MRLHSGFVVAGVVAAIVGGACGSEDPGDSAPATPIATEIGGGWMLAAPEGWIVEGTFGEGVESGSGCVVDQVSVSRGDTTTDIALVSPECSADVNNRGNGAPADFGSADQLDGAADIETTDTSVGKLTIATVGYFECTNECNEYMPNVGVIELDDPSDSFRTIVIRDDSADTTREDILFIAEHLSHR